MDTNKMRIAEYLGALDLSACAQYCTNANLQFCEVTPFEFNGPDDVFNCLRTFLGEGVSPHFLFKNADLWGSYLKSISDARFHNGIELALSTGNPADLIMYFRACYRFGFPVIDDKSFDVLEDLYISTYPALSFLEEQTYDDDEYNSIVMNAVKMSGVRNVGKSAAASLNKMNLADNPEYADLNTEKSTSIRPVITPEEAFEFWRNAPSCRVHFSLKIDGVNTKALFSSEEGKGLELSISRGRATDSIDYTEALKNALQSKGVTGEALFGRVTGESFVGLNDLKIIQNRYVDKDYKTPKSTAMAMLRAPGNFMVEDYKYLSFFAFDYNGMRPDKAFKELQAAGLQVPPYLIFDGKDIPRTSVEEFNNWLIPNVLDPMWDFGEKLGIGSDGVVMYLLADINTERNDKYSDSNIAIKYHHWAAATYVSRVKRIVFEQKRVEASIVLEIEPVVMRDKNTATRVGVGSPDILICDNVRVGDMIEFERKSEAYNVYLRKRV